MLIKYDARFDLTWQYNIALLRLDCIIQSVCKCTVQLNPKLGSPNYIKHVDMKLAWYVVRPGGVKSTESNNTRK